MERLSDLKELINNQCVWFGGYNELLLKDCVVAFVLYHDILVDTLDWDNTIDYLWANLDTQALRDSFGEKEDFDNYMASDLV